MASPTSTPSLSTRGADGSERKEEEGAGPRAWGDEAFDTAYDSFRSKGYVVIPLMSKERAAKYAQRVVDAVVGAPEYTTPPKVQRGADGVAVKPYERHILGGFGGVWNSANHCPAVRELMQMHYKLVQRLVRKGRAEWRYVREMPDRLLVRDADSKVCAESWHRDCAETSKEAFEDRDNVRLGGWIALSTADGSSQYFSCVPGTSLWRTVSGGFSKLSKSDAAEYAKQATTVEIPLGHCIVFDETIVHEVRPSSKPKGWPRGKPIPPQVRLMTAAEWSNHRTAQHPWGPDGLRKALRDGAVIPLKSGQLQRGYPKMYWGPPKLMSHLKKAAARLRPEYTETRTMKKTGSKTTTPCEDHFPTMVEAGLPAPGYTENEILSFTHGFDLATAGTSAAGTSDTTDSTPIASPRKRSAQYSPESSPKRARAPSIGA